LVLLCQDQGLRALSILGPLAAAGDTRALEALVFLGNGGNCEWQVPPRHRDVMLELARQRGASAQTLQRLDDMLTREVRGPTAAQLATCRQANAAVLKARPALLQQFVELLGRSVETLRGENEQDVHIEYARKMLVPGDSDGQLRLAQELLAKDTPESQAEALALLREAASRSPAAASSLALCLLKGCPEPTADPGEARQLLEQAAAAGDLMALMLLAGPAYEEGRDWDPGVPAAERYAWSQFLERLSAEGCFGVAQYASWATAPRRPPTLQSLSPADAESAQVRTAALLGEPLTRVRERLGCD
jgi:TPR repeat protein